jgi:hypothetical protein
MNKMSLKPTLVLISTLMITSLFSCKSRKKDNFENIVAVMSAEGKVDNLCMSTQVFVILPLPGNGQVRAVPPISEEELIKQLNDGVAFAGEHSEQSFEMKLDVYINCHGDMVACILGQSSGFAELDDQVLAVFKQLNHWQPGTVKGKKVDTMRLFTIAIQNGQISL